MDLRLRSTGIYGFLVVIWLLMVGWQVEEHARVRDAAQKDLRGRAGVYANFLSATIRGQRFRATVFQERLEPVLKALIRTNELARPSELVAIMLLNQAGEAVVSEGDTNVLQPDVLQQGEHWGPKVVTFVDPVLGMTVAEGETNNSIFVAPPRREFTNEMRDREFPRPESPTNISEIPSTNEHGVNENERREPHREGKGPPPPPDDGGPRGPGGGRRGGGFRGGGGRPPWLNWMSEDEYKKYTAQRELHGLVLAMSTEKFRASMIGDLWVRFWIIILGGISVAGYGLAWRTVGRSSDLQIRLVRASEMNTHLREMNLAAAGLAHETRNPLNIIRGMAQMLSRQPDATPEIKEKSAAIVNETDKVTAQLNEFINYSRPREIRRVPLGLPAAAQEVVRALNFDLEEKKVKLEVKGDAVTVEADQQLFRQMLFNLLLNAVQALEPGGEIQVVTIRKGPEATLEIRDNGPGVPPERRKEIFKPYFTTHQKGTGLGLAVVQQIVLAHGWEIECLGNEPRGAVFRITHLKVTA